MSRAFFAFVFALSVPCLLSTQATAESVPAVQSFTLDDPTAALETWGYEFRVNSDFQVTALGFWDYMDDGLNTSHDIGLWTSSGSFLGSVTVPSGTVGALDSHYRYADLSSPVLLSAGSDYRLGAYCATEYFPRVFASTIVTDSRISLNSGTVYRHVGGSGLFFPESGISGTPYAYIAGNLKINAVPEPSILILLLIAGISLSAYRITR